LEKVVVIIDPNDEHDVVAPAPVSDDIMSMGPAYKMRGPTASMTCWCQCQLHGDDIMAVGPAYQLNSNGSLDPQQAESKLIPLIFKPSMQPSGKPIPSMDLQTQQAAKYWPEGHLQADNMPIVVFSHAGQHTSIFCNDPLESCPY